LKVGTVTGWVTAALAAISHGVSTRRDTPRVALQPVERICRAKLVSGLASRRRTTASETAGTRNGFAATQRFLKTKTAAQKFEKSLEKVSHGDKFAQYRSRFELQI